MPIFTDRKSWTAQTTTDSYVSLGEAWQKPHSIHGHIVIKNTHAANAAKVKVLAGLVRGDYVKELQAETTIAAEASLIVELSTFWPFVDVQVKADSAGNQATVSAEGRAILS